jgi:iron complex outermembrane receptor protein
MIGEGLLTGIINPFGAQSSAGTALLEDSLLRGLLQTSTGKVTSFKAGASRELGDWLNAGRPVQVAIGGDFRQEDFIDKANTEFAKLVSASTGVDPNTLNKGKRDVTAAYSEINLPITRDLDVTGSVRHDIYSDFGSSTNPKVAFRFQPTKTLLVRGSASTGFRAPSLYELNGSQVFTNSGNYNNPVNCPGGQAIAGASAGANCDSQFQVLQGGNTSLKPEKAKNLTFGFVVQPTANLTTSIDFWRVDLTNTIGALPQNTLFSNYAQFSQYFNFAAGNLLSITSNCPGPKCGYVDTRNQNLGDVNTDGIDLGAQHRLRTNFGQFDSALQTTYVRKYEYQDYANGPFNQSVSVFSGPGPVFRWQHNLRVNWSRDQYLAGLAAHYKSGYKDFAAPNIVSGHTTLDAYGGWEPKKGMSVIFGIKNLANVAPPFSNQAALFQSGGWDSRYSSALGRTFYLRATMAF